MGKTKQVVSDQTKHGKGDVLKWKSSATNQLHKLSKQSGCCPQEKAVGRLVEQTDKSLLLIVITRPQMVWRAR